MQDDQITPSLTQGGCEAEAPGEGMNPVMLPIPEIQKNTKPFLTARRILWALCVQQGGYKYTKNSERGGINKTKKGLGG